MKKAVLTILVPFVLVAGAAVGLYWWDNGAPPGFRPIPADVSVADISRNNRGVRIHGTAHYAVRLVQRTSQPDALPWYLFPLMAQGDTTGRTVHVLVRTQRKPDDMLGYEDLTIEGLARPPGRLVGASVLEALLSAGYDFDDDYVLVEAWDD